MASPIYLWYTKEVFYWRSLAASLWSIICLPLLIFLMSLTLSISLNHPVGWLSDAVTEIFSISFLINLVSFIVAVITVTWFSLPYSSVKPEIYSSRLSCMLSLFLWSRLPLLVICLLTGTLCAWSVANFIGSHFTEFISTEEFEKTVLNEESMFIIGCGMFTGFCYYWHFFTRQQCYLSFPTIQRQKVFQVRSEMKLMAERIAWQILHIVKYYYIIYFLFGSLPRIWICSSFGISEDPGAIPLDSILGLMSLSLLWRTYLTSFTLTFALSFTFALTRIFHTEQLELPITSILEQSSGKTLPDALACVSSPLLQHLAFYDLACLSKYDSPRFQEILSLSQPGGHPKVWLMVSGSALSVIHELTNRVKEENWSIMSKVPIYHHRNGVANGNGYYSQGFTGDRIDSSLGYRGDSNQDDALRMREESEKPSVMSQMGSKVSSLPILSQLLVQSQDTNSRRLFATCQLQIWAVESLSHISVRAYDEDRYGVVQSSLPIVFMSLLELYESMEKHFKLSTSSRRPNGSAPLSVDHVIRYKLHSVLKASLYRMVNTYKMHLEDIKLKQDEIKKLTPFIQYSL